MAVSKPVVGVVNINPETIAAIAVFRRGSEEDALLGIGKIIPDGFVYTRKTWIPADDGDFDCVVVLAHAR